MNYFRRLLDANDPASIRRFTILAVVFHYMITCYAALFMDKSIANTTLISTITEYNFYIILMGMFGLTVDKVAGISLKKAEVIANAQPPVNIQQAENVNTNTTKAETVNAKNVETVNTNTTTIAPGSQEQVNE